MNILFADSQGVVRHGLITLVKDLLPDVEVLQAENFHQICIQLRYQNINILFLNTDMFGEHSISSIMKFKSIHPELRILLLSTYTEKVFAPHLTAAGAEGFINAQHSLDEIKKSILNFFDHIKYSPVAIPKIVPSRQNNEITSQLNNMFSERELSVLAFIRKGVPLIEIAKLLSIKPSTVSTYKQRIYTKLGVDNYRELTDLLIMAS